ncbi:MAG: hypothetical protein IJW46_07375 [Clostridia bacterium]|nr:hypothetical protein [Clostridia bacterium]
MKKLLLLLFLVTLLTLVFVSCNQPDDSVLTPNTAPPLPPYVPEPLTVEFFNTSYKNMSQWQKYPIGENLSPDLPEAETSTEAIVTSTLPETTDTPTTDTPTAE